MQKMRYFVDLRTWGTETPNIIDDKVMVYAEQGKNYLNPDDYDFLCEAECMKDAEEFYFEKHNDELFIAFCEKDHP